VNAGQANPWLVAAGLLFSVFVVVKLLRPAVPRDERWRDARRRIADAKRRAGEQGASASVRAAALREAASAALEDLKRPGLAASYARRAERLDPSDAESVGIVALALRRAARYRALERFLWRRLAEGPQLVGPAAHARSLAELVALYEGPLGRPEIATVLRRLGQDPG
jgi:hypothetical protein